MKKNLKPGQYFFHQNVLLLKVLRYQYIKRLVVSNMNLTPNSPMT